MKQVFLCIPTLASAGAERFVTELACNIDQKRYVPTVLVTKHLDFNSAFYKQLVNYNIRVVNAGDCSYFKTVFLIVKLLNKEKPVIIHTNVGAALHMLIPQIISYAKFEHVFTTHSMGYRIFSGIKKKIIQFCFKRQMIIPVAICDTVKKSLIEAYDLYPDKVHCVYNGVDTTTFIPIRNKREEDNEIIIISVGTLYQIKNHRLLIDAFDKAYNKDHRLKLLIVGDGELREELNQKISCLDLIDKVKLVGNQKDVCSLLQKADIYCCSSIVEGLPISVLEAMACGLPIITTPAGGVVDIVDGQNGIIVDYEAESIAKAILLLAADVSLRIEKGYKSREKAEKLSIKNCANQYMEIYDRYTKRK